MASTDGPDGERMPLVLIHGAWLSADSWENFAGYFEERGFAVSAPEWPRKHGDVVEELRADGGEFAAWEQPQLFSEEVRSAFRSSRRGHATNGGQS